MKKVFVASLFAFSAALIPLAGAHAQTAGSQGPKLLITWRAADSIVPTAYVGKPLPMIGTQMVASVEVVTNGGLANLNSRTIYWYLDGGLVGGGIGKQNVTFLAPGHVEIMALRAEIPDYPTGLLTNTVRIQVVSPKVVLVTPYFNNLFSGSTVAIHADTFFWSRLALKNAVFHWSVSGQDVNSAENPQDLTINLGPNTSPGYTMGVTLIMQRSDDPLTNAHATITLTKATQ